MEAESVSGLLNKFWSGAIHPLVLSFFFVWLNVTLINPIIRRLEAKVRRKKVEFHKNKIEKFLFRAIPIVVGIDILFFIFGTVDWDALVMGLSIVTAPVLIVTVFVYVVYPFLVLALVFPSELLKEISILLFKRNSGEYSPGKNIFSLRTFISFFAVAWVCFIFSAPIDLLWHDYIFQVGEFAPPSQASQILAQPIEEPILFFGMTKNFVLRIAELIALFFIHLGFIFWVAKPLLLNPERLLPFPRLRPLESKISFWLVTFIYLPAIMILVILT